MLKFIISLFLIFTLICQISPLKCGYQSYPNCLSCQSDNFGCSACESYNQTLKTAGFTLYQNSCIQCTLAGSQSPNIGCIKCLGNGKCDIGGCTLGYYYDSGVCKLCPTNQNCLNCSNANTCSGCADGFYLDQNTCQNCTRLSPNCLKCSATACSGCFPGYLLNGKGGCDPCLDSNCLDCDPSSCKTCISGYYPYKKQCLQCSVASCSSCPDNFCQSCNVPLALNNSFWPITCISCDRGLLNVTSNCSSCKYDEDLQNFTCLTCADGFYLDASGICQACSESCLRCIDSSICLNCSNSTILQISSTITHSCMKFCDVSKQANMLLNGACYSCSAYYSGNCTKCDTSKCLACASPTQYLRPPWNISCESCDLLGIDIKYGDGVCYQNPTASIDSVVPNSDNVYSLTLNCQVPSVIYIVLGLEWGNIAADGSVLDVIDLQTVENKTGIIRDIWIDRQNSDPYWMVYGRMTTDMKGQYSGVMAASIKLSGDIYSIKIWCISLSGNVVSTAVSKQFYPQYNMGYISVITVKTNDSLTSDNKSIVAKALYNLMNLNNALRVLITDEGVEVNRTSSGSRILSNTTQNTTNTTNATIVYQTTFFYCPPNWTLTVDSYDANISEIVIGNDFLKNLNQAISTSKIVIQSISADSQDEQGQPSFASTQLLILNSNQTLGFSLQLNKVNGYISVGVAESNPIDNKSNITTLTQSSLNDRIPSWDQMNKLINAVGTKFSNFQRFFAIQGKKNVILIDNLKSNTTYDIYFGATNADFPFYQSTNIYGELSFTRMNIFGERLGIYILLFVILSWVSMIFN